MSGATAASFFEPLAMRMAPTRRDAIEEYSADRAPLGWLVDPLQKRVAVCRPGQAVEYREDPETLSADPVLPGFVPEVRNLW